MGELRDLTCPVCHKLLGKTEEPLGASALELWCRRCKHAVTPIVRKTREA